MKKNMNLIIILLLLLIQIMKQLIINQSNIYKVNDIEYFQFNTGYHNLRDINTNISNNNKFILKIIAKYCELNYKGLNKLNLINLIENSNCLIFNQFN